MARFLSLLKSIYLQAHRRITKEYLHLIARSQRAPRSRSAGGSVGSPAHSPGAKAIAGSLRAPACFAASTADRELRWADLRTKPISPGSVHTTAFVPVPALPPANHRLCPRQFQAPQGLASP